MTQVDEHFAKIASAYRDARTTDLEPILYIKELIGDSGPLVAADVGCGAGRYDLLLHRRLGHEMFLHCIDANTEMLEELDDHLTAEGISDFQTHRALAGDLPLDDGSLDCMFTFNACHHFELKSFFAETRRTLKLGGKLFVYTRTRTQNARSCWGVHFPGFNEKENRLYEVHEVAQAAAQIPDLEMVEFKAFRYDRTADLERLLDQARNRHYSTFSLYDTEEFEVALDEFTENVKACYDDIENVTWRDENILYVFERTG